MPIMSVYSSCLILFMDLRKEAMKSVGITGILCMLSFVIISMGVGCLWWPAEETRPVLATVTGMRHVALSLLIASIRSPTLR